MRSPTKKFDGYPNDRYVCARGLVPGEPRSADRVLDRDPGAR